MSPLFRQGKCSNCGGSGHYPDFEDARQKLGQLNKYVYTFNTKLDDINREVRDLNEITKEILSGERR